MQLWRELLHFQDAHQEGEHDRPTRRRSKGLRKHRNAHEKAGGQGIQKQVLRLQPQPQGLRIYNAEKGRVTESRKVIFLECPVYSKPLIGTVHLDPTDDEGATYAKDDVDHCCRLFRGPQTKSDGIGIPNQETLRNEQINGGRQDERTIAEGCTCLIARSSNSHSTNDHVLCIVMDRTGRYRDTNDTRLQEGTAQHRRHYR